MKKLYLVNAPEDSFVRSFTTVAGRYDVDLQRLATENMIVWVRGRGDIVFFSENDEVDRDGSFFYFKKVIHDKLFVSILCSVLDREGRPFTDREANLGNESPSAKIPMMAKLAAHSLPVPASFICTKHSYEINRRVIGDSVSYPCVVKKTGSQGRSVWKVDSREELEEKLYQDDELSLIQEYLPNDHDIRVIVVEGVCIGAVKRSSVDGFYNNVSQGGKAERVDISEEEERDSLRAAEIGGLSVAGVDLMRIEGGGHIILETNKNPSRDLFNEALGFSVTERIAEILIKRHLSS